MPWPWNGYINWKDEKTPPLMHYSKHTDRFQDLYPTLNQTKYTLEYGEDDKSILVYLETETPNFKKFLVSQSSLL
jgi:hypothetical protein